MSNRIKLDRPKARAPLSEDRGEYAGQVNLYQCKAGHRRFTINRDRGVTPSSIPCGRPDEHDPHVVCWERMWSTWYSLPPDFRGWMITHEWWLPTIEQAMTWPNKTKREREEIAAHVQLHGMMLATLTEETGRRWVVGEWCPE